MRLSVGGLSPPTPNLRLGFPTLPRRVSSDHQALATRFPNRAVSLGVTCSVQRAGPFPPCYGKPQHFHSYQHSKHTPEHGPVLPEIATGNGQNLRSVTRERAKLPKFSDWVITCAAGRVGLGAWSRAWRGRPVHFSHQRPPIARIGVAHDTDRAIVSAENDAFAPAQGEEHLPIEHECCAHR